MELGFELLRLRLSVARKRVLRLAALIPGYTWLF